MPGQLTVQDVLALPEVQSGHPRIIAGKNGLARKVRWAHVIAGSTTLNLLDGGELLLTTGAGWPADDSEIATLAAALASAAPAAIFIELGKFLATTPTPLIAICEGHGIPLVELDSEVKFVHITQRIHQHILSRQTAALEARAEVHEMLTELGLNRSPVDYVIERLADTLQASVVLEDSAGHVVAWSKAGAHTETAAMLAPWSTRDVQIPQDWDRVPVEAQGRHWGTLTALPGPEHPAGRRTVLELGAFALALGRLADPAGEQWPRLGARRALTAMLQGRYRSSEDLQTQLASAGLKTAGRTLLAVTLKPVWLQGGFSSLPVSISSDKVDEELMQILEKSLQRAAATWGDALLAYEPTHSALHQPAEIFGIIALDSESALLGIPSATPISSTAQIPRIAKRLADELQANLPNNTPPNLRAHLSLSEPVANLRALVPALDKLRGVGPLPVGTNVGRVSVQQMEQHRLAGLIHGFSTFPEVQQFATQILEPVLHHDKQSGTGHPGDLLDILRAYLAYPTNRSLAAREAKLSRSVFYQRIDMLSELLDADLTDGNVIATLKVALLALDTRA